MTDTEKGELVQTAGSSILQPARYGFAPEQVQAIKNTVAKDCSDAELVMFLEVCARYGLDPFAKQAYAAKMGGGGVSIIVSRDGLLAHAHKQPDFVKLDCDVVRKGDTFEVTFVNGERQVKHGYGDPTARGEVIGAWACVERRDHGTTYFYAPLEEYKRSSPIWSKHPSAMILKVAESYALRKAYSISGIVGEAEVDVRPPQNLTRNVAPDYGSDPELAKELQEAIQQAQTTAPDQWRPAKVNALLHDATDDQRRALLEELRAVAEPVVEAEVIE
jgi:phage recombination protein Bet